MLICRRGDGEAIDQTWPGAWYFEREKACNKIHTVTHKNNLIFQNCEKTNLEQKLLVSTL